MLSLSMWNKHVDLRKQSIRVLLATITDFSAKFVINELESEHLKNERIWKAASTDLFKLLSLEKYNKNYK